MNNKIRTGDLIVAAKKLGIVNLGGGGELAKEGDLFIVIKSGSDKSIIFSQNTSSFSSWGPNLGECFLKYDI